MLVCAFHGFISRHFVYAYTTSTINTHIRCVHFFPLPRDNLSIPSAQIEFTRHQPNTDASVSKD